MQNLHLFNLIFEIKSNKYVVSGAQTGTDGHRSLQMKYGVTCYFLSKLAGSLEHYCSVCWFLDVLLILATFILQSLHIELILSSSFVPSRW